MRRSVARLLVLFLITLPVVGAESNITPIVSLGDVKREKLGIEITFSIENPTEKVIYFEKSNQGPHQLHSVFVERLSAKRWLPIGPLADMPAKSLFMLIPLDPEAGPIAINTHPHRASMIHSSAQSLLSRYGGALNPSLSLLPFPV
jgi:hypothetical protein